MSKVYIGQTSLRLKLTTGVDITGATSLLIKFKRPTLTTGSWTAHAYDETNGIIYYDFSATTELNVAGKWVVWAYATFSDGRSAAGEPYKFRVYEEGT